MRIIDLYIALLEHLHSAILDEAMGDTTKLFVRQLHWSIIGGLGAAGILFFVTILAGRVLGASQYGQYSFALAISQMISLLMVWGFEPAIARTLAISGNNVSSQKNIISSAIIFLAITAIGVNIIIYFLPLQFDKGIIMALATFTALKLLLDGIMRGLGLFAYQAVGRIVESLVLVIIFFLTLWFFNITLYRQYLLIVLVGSAVASIYYVGILQKFTSVRQVSFSAVRMLWMYGSMAIIGSIIATVLGFAVKFVIRYELGYEFLGQFTAYHMASIVLLGFVSQLVVNVFFPIAVRGEHYHALWRKMNRGVRVTWFPMWVLAAFLTNVAVVVYGPSYYLSHVFGIGMAGVGVIQLFSGMYLWLIASTGVRGIRYISIHSGIAGCLFISMLALTIPFNPTVGILASYALSDAYVVWVIRRWVVA